MGFIQAASRYLRLCQIGLVVGLSVQLIACAPIAPQLSQSSAQTTVTVTTHSGRFAVRHNLQGETSSGQGRFVWLQAPHEQVLTLYSPLGSTLTELRWQVGTSSAPAQAWLVQPGQATRSAADPQILLDELLGWPLPLRLFPAWLSGRPADPQIPLTLDETSGATDSARQRFVEQGWEVKTTTAEQGAQTVLSKVRIKRQFDATHQLDVRIQLDEPLAAPSSP